MKTESEIKKMLEHEEWLIGYNKEITHGQPSSLVRSNKVRIDLLKTILEIK